MFAVLTNAGGSRITTTLTTHSTPRRSTLRPMAIMVRSGTDRACGVSDEPGSGAGADSMSGPVARTGCPNLMC